jgi:hypothetical protein
LSDFESAVAVDQSGNNRHGAYIGSFGYKLSPFGGCAPVPILNGVDSYIDLTDSLSSVFDGNEGAVFLDISLDESEWACVNNRSLLHVY